MCYNDAIKISVETGYPVSLGGETSQRNSSCSAFREEKMISVAVIEDQKADAEKIVSHLEKFCTAEKIEYKVDAFSDGMFFIDKSRSNYDIVILDIEMPLLDGMSTAKKLRESGWSGQIIFVTNMAQYAISGYEVEASAYLVKPVIYYNFAGAMKKVLLKMRKQEGKGRDIVIPSKQNGASIISSSVLRYIEVVGHDLYFNTETGVFCYHRKSLKEFVSELPADSFAHSSNHCVVNFKYVSCLKGNQIILTDGTELDITRSKKKEFIERFMAYIR